MINKRYSTFAWGVLVLNVFVILWGAFVRATGSGAGCGSHWPMCNGEVIPWAPATETIIEFTHRITSGLALLAVIGLLVWGFRAYPKGHPVRLGAVLTMVFMVIETLVGAALVLFELVAYNPSMTRAVIMAIHLINTFLLLAALTITAWWASGGQPVRLKGQGKLAVVWGIAFAGMLLLGASGGITALGNMLFPSESLLEGFQEDFSPTAHILIRLRVFHPLIAIAVGAYIVAAAAYFNTRRPTPHTQLFGKIFAGLYVVQLIAGAFNVVLFAPVWLQLLHLFISDLMVIYLMLLMAAIFAQPATDVEEVPLPTYAAGQKALGETGS